MTTDADDVVQVPRAGWQEHGPDQGPDTDRGAAGVPAQQGAAQTGGHDEPPQAGQEREGRRERREDWHLGTQEFRESSKRISNKAVFDRFTTF